MFFQQEPEQRCYTPPHKFASFSFRPVAESLSFSNGRVLFNYSPILCLHLGVGVCSGD